MAPWLMALGVASSCTTSVSNCERSMPFASVVDVASFERLSSTLPPPLRSFSPGRLPSISNFCSESCATGSLAFSQTFFTASYSARCFALSLSSAVASPHDTY